MTSQHWAPVHCYGSERSAPIVLICEHASFLFPDEFGTLGLDTVARNSHVAGDVGALAVAKGLSDILDAPLVYGGVSRLLYDCNRPLDAEGAIPVKSEVFDIPGNIGLSPDQKRARFDAIHQPFHAAVDQQIEALERRTEEPVVIITIHSFTPVYYGTFRDVEIGFLHDNNATLSKLSLQAVKQQGNYDSYLNRPYDASDGVTYTLQKHAEKRHLDSTMVEIRSDLIDTDVAAQKMAAHLAVTLNTALKALHTQGETA